MKHLISLFEQYRQITILFFVSFIATLWTLMMNHSEFSSQELIFFSGYIGVIVSLQLVIIFLLLICKRIHGFFDYLASAAATVFSVLNVYTMIVVHHTTLATLPPLYFSGLITLMTLFFAIPFFVRWRPFVKFIHIFAIIMSVIIGVQLIADSSFSVRGLFDRIPSHFKMVEFKEKPNIYVISLDALTPAVVARNNLGVESVPYQDVLEGKDIRIIPNSFAERVPTKQSLNLLLAMDKNYFESVSEDAGFVRDQVPNPAYETLRHNGYKIQVIYKNRYFGDDHGKLDYYGIAEPYGVCSHTIKDYVFLGYCSPYIQNLAENITKNQQTPYPQMLYDRIKTTANTQDNWFTFASVYTPGHADNDTRYNSSEDWNDYKRKFTKKAPKAASVLENLLQVINRHDPASVTLITGDHGSLASLGALGDPNGLVSDALAHKKEFRKDSPVSFEQVVHDRHAVLNILMPADFCPEGFSHNPYSNLRIMRDIFICLSGENPLPDDYQPDDDHWAPYKYQ